MFDKSWQLPYPLQRLDLGMHLDPSSQANMSVEQGGLQWDSDSSDPSSQLCNPYSTGGQKWEQLRGWQRALRQDRHVQQADRRCLRGEAHLRNISVNL